MVLKQRRSAESMNDLCFQSVFKLQRKSEKGKLRYTVREQIAELENFLLYIYVMVLIFSGSFQKSAKNLIYPNCRQSP